MSVLRTEPLSNWAVVGGRARLAAGSVTHVLPSRVIEIVEYIDTKGKNPFRRWVSGLDAGARARVLAAVLRMEGGNFSVAKGIGSGVSELRLDFGPGYRIYFGRDGERLVILLGGGSKKRQQTDIEEAHACWAAYKRRKREE